MWYCWAECEQQDFLSVRHSLYRSLCRKRTQRVGSSLQECVRKPPNQPSHPSIVSILQLCFLDSVQLLVRHVLWPIKGGTQFADTWIKARHGLVVCFSARKPKTNTRRFRSLATSTGAETKLKNDKPMGCCLPAAPPTIFKIVYVRVWSSNPWVPSVWSMSTDTIADHFNFHKLLNT
jgi:hypothetical protein